MALEVYCPIINGPCINFLEKNGDRICGTCRIAEEKLPEVAKDWLKRHKESKKGVEIVKDVVLYMNGVPHGRLRRYAIPEGTFSGYRGRREILYKHFEVSIKSGVVNYSPYAFA